jgi:hypothetical protein
MIQFKRFFSFDSPKAIKAKKFKYLNAINYMAPHKSAGVGNLCSHASIACINLCLGRESGQASMVSAATNWTNNVRQSRERKARYFMGERAAYMVEFAHHVAAAVRTARRKRIKLAVRPNGATDVAYEMIRFMVDPALAGKLAKIAGRPIEPGLHTIFTLFPFVQFLDYTKNPLRFKRALPANYDLTFSRSETNESDCLAVLASGRNVAIVFGDGLPAMWNGFRVINGDLHDLRHLDPKGVVVGLSPKGPKAKRDMSGFVLRSRSAADRPASALAAA